MSDSTTNFEMGSIKITDSSGNTSSISNVESLDMEVNSTLNTDGIDIENTEYECSVDVELETDETVCPHCNEINHLPNGKLLGIVTKAPVPCVSCGYPLL